MPTEDGSAPVIDSGAAQPVEAVDTNALGGVSIPQATQGNDNPAWAPYLEKFPEPVRGIARETFSEWDKGVQRRFGEIHDQYRDFKQFADQGVKPEDLQNAWGLASILQNDPQGFAQMLAQHLGMTIQQAEAATEQLQQEDSSQGELDPRIQKLQKDQQELMDYIRHQEESAQQAQMAQQQEQQLTAEMSDLEKKYGINGKMDDFIKNKVLEEALRLSMLTDKPVTMEQAYLSLEQFVSQVRTAPRPGDSAPRVMSSGGMQPVTLPVDPGKMSGKQTREYAAEVAARLLKTGTN